MYYYDLDDDSRSEIKSVSRGVALDAKPSEDNLRALSTRAGGISEVQKKADAIIGK